MSAVPSNLSNPKYLYDFVVATTQESINATMMAFLAQLTEPIVTVCYVADASGNPTPIPYATLMKNANGTDPFAIPANVDVSTSKDIQNLYGARFMLAFRAQLGLPHVQNPESLDDIVKLGNSISSVVFNMYCSTFNIVQYSLAGYAPAKWMNISQDPSSPWVFTSTVDLRLEDVPGTAYSTLPPDVQKKIENIGSGAFSVQQLLFDLSNATLESLPKIGSGITPGTPVYTALQMYFLGAYFAQMQSEGQPLLGCSITMNDAPASSLKLASLDLMVNPYLDDQGRPVESSLTTLNYLCSVTNSLPPAVKFSWNWIPDAAAQKDHDGVVAINRDSFVTYFRALLTPYVKQNCLLTATAVYYEVEYVDYWWNFTPGQKPTVTTPSSGSTVLTYHYYSESHDSSGPDGWFGYLQLKDTYDMTVQFIDKTIVITQHQVVYADVSHLGADGSGNIVDKTIVDTYTLGVNEDGKLVAALDTQTTDNSYNPTVDGFLNWFTDINQLIADVETYVRSFTSTQLDIPVSIVQDFVFPGGNTFVFKDAGFSPYQDLVSYISYADVTGQPVPTVPTTSSRAKKTRMVLSK